MKKVILAMLFLIPIKVFSSGNILITGSSGGGSGTITGVTAGTGLSGGGTSGTVTVNMANTAVSAGSYTNTNLTVDAQGRITSATNGTGGGSSASTLAVGTGTASNFTNNVTSPTAAMNFEGGDFNSAALGTTNYVKLSPTGVLSGTYGSATQVSSFTVASNGRITGASNVTISLTNSNLQSGTYGNVTIPAANVAAGSLGLSVLASSFPVTSVTAGSYTNTNLTVDAYGRLTAASNGSSGSGGGYSLEPATVTIRVATITAPSGISQLLISTNTTIQGSATINSTSTINSQIGTGLVVYTSTNNPYTFTVSTSAVGGPFTLFVSTNGNIGGAGPSPNLTSCGGSPSLNSTASDFGGTITVGTSIGGCTLNFANPFNVAPSCSISERTQSLTNALSYTISTSAITFTQTSMGGSIIDYICKG